MKNTVYLASLFAIAMGLAALPAVGEESEAAQSSGSVTVGAQGGSGIDTSSKLQEYEIVHKGVFVPAASFDWQNGSNYYLNFKGTELGLDDQFAGVSVGKKDGFQLNLSWDMNPNWLSNTGRTPYTENIASNTAFYHVPDGMRLALQNIYAPWVPATTANPIGLGNAPADPTKAGFFAVEPWVADSQPVDLRYVRKTGKAGLTLPVGEALKLSLSYSREQRDGDKNTTFYGGQNFEVATPIAYRTDNVRAGAEFAKGRWFGNAGLNYSKFHNDVPYAEIDNPERLELANPANQRSVVTDATVFRLWLPPDNKAVSVDFSGGVKLPRRHKITVSLAVGDMSMDHDLLPLSTNPNLATSATTPAAGFSVTPPYNSVSAKYDTFMGAVKLTGDPSTKFGYSVSWRRYQLTDKTADYQFLSTVRGDVNASQLTSDTALIRDHEGYETQSIKGEAHVLPKKGLRFGVSYAEEKHNYDVREYADVEDHVLVASADYAHKWWSLHGSYTDLNRQPGSVNEPPPWDGATQTDITRRHRKSYSGLLTLTPNGVFAITVTGMQQTNAFAESVTGLLDQSAGQLGADLTYAPSQRFSASGGYVYESYDFRMAAAYIPRGSNPPYLQANYWENASKDRVHTLRASVQWTLLPDKFDVDANVDYALPRNDSQYTFAPGGLNEGNGVFPANAPPIPGFPVTSFTSFPRVSKNFLIAKVVLNYHLDKNLTASAMWWKQRFDNLDWQTDSMLPYMGHVDPGANRWFFLGAQVPSYNADIFRVALTYKF